MARDQQQSHQGPTVLVTGGAGYIGSHTVVLLLESKFRVVVVDSCKNAYYDEQGATEDENNNNQPDSNGNQRQDLPESLRRVEMITGQSLTAFYKMDLVTSLEQLSLVFRQHQIAAVIHFAALKSVNESIARPLEYYTNNLIGTINLLNTMKRFGCRNLIFSSSATVYGLPQYTPVDESHQFGLNILNPYGRTKCMVEEILRDLCNNQQQQQLVNCSNWNITALRYFNPVGAHPSGHIGEHTLDVPNNLMPYISQVAAGKREKLFVFGNDFETVDGTGVRDYIHIMDLANGHIQALKYLISDLGAGTNSRGYRVFNLGTGKGYSVLEMIETFERVNKVKIPFEIIGRREGDAGKVYANAKLALKELNWSAKYNLIDMCRDTYRWQTMYPEGFKTPLSREPIG